MTIKVKIKDGEHAGEYLPTQNPMELVIDAGETFSLELEAENGVIDLDHVYWGFQDGESYVTINNAERRPDSAYKAGYLELTALENPYGTNRIVVLSGIYAPTDILTPDEAIIQVAMFTIQTE